MNSRGTKQFDWLKKTLLSNWDLNHNQGSTYEELQAWMEKLTWLLR